MTRTAPGPVDQDAGATARRLRSVYEPVHSVVYFTPESREAFERAGLRGFWRGYFAGRAAPFGPVGPGAVTAVFFVFSPAMVARALPDVWTRASPAAALAARQDGAVAALRRLGGDDAVRTAVEALPDLRRALDGLDHAGRALAGANADLAWPDEPVGALWHACTLLREHRGDGHMASLLAAGLDGVEALVLRAALDDTRDVLQPTRSWTDAEWDAAAGRLTARGWLDGAGAPTAAGREAHRAVEAGTDALAAAPWRALGPDRCATVEAALAPLSRAAATVLPARNPLGLPPA